MPWNPEKARQFLAHAAHERAKGPGLSDTALGRLAALQDPAGAESKAAFARALQRAGWRPRRITRAVALVVGEKTRPKLSWWRLWMQRWMFRPGEVDGMPNTALVIAGVSMLLLSLSAVILTVVAHPIGTAGLALVTAGILWRRARRKKATRFRPPREEGEDNTAYLKTAYLKMVGEADHRIEARPLTTKRQRIVAPVPSAKRKRVAPEVEDEEDIPPVTRRTTRGR